MNIFYNISNESTWNALILIINCNSWQGFACEATRRRVFHAETCEFIISFIYLPKRLSTCITLSSELIQFAEYVSGESKHITSPTEKIVFKAN